MACVAKMSNVGVRGTNGLLLLVVTVVYFISFLWMGSCQNILYNCDPDDANCLCADVTNVSTCFCDWGYVLDPDYPPAIGKMKFCTKYCKGGHLHCWTSTTSRAICPAGVADCVCAFGYTAVLRSEQVLCEAVNCHKAYGLNDNELCDCGAHGMNSTELVCECVDGFVGNKTNHPGFCKGFQCLSGEGSFCYCPNGPTDPTSCSCQTSPGAPTKHSFLVTNPISGVKERLCIEGGTCGDGEMLNSNGDNSTECTKDQCIKGSPFCNTQLVYRECEEGYTANWDLTCVPVQCNDKILNTDVSFCTCPTEASGITNEQGCRCFVNYVMDFDKPGQCRKLCDVNMANCMSEDGLACTESNNQNCECAEGYQAALLDTDKDGNIKNVNSENGHLVPSWASGYDKQISGFKVGCVPVCDTLTTDCTTDENDVIKCRDGFTPNWNQVCVPYECNAGFEPETFHCDCDQDAFGSYTEIAGLITADPSENPLTCYCLPGYISAFLDGKRYCKEQVCDPFSDPFCSAEANDDGTLKVDTSSCNQWYIAMRNVSYDTDPEDDTEAWKAVYLPECLYSQNVTYCESGSFGCDPNCPIGSTTCECDYEEGYTGINGRCYQLTCDLAVVLAQYPGGTAFQAASQICTQQINPDFNRQYYYCSPGFFPNGTGGCDMECSSYFPECQKYADFNHYQCSFGYAPNLFVNTEGGFMVDHTCVSTECNSIKEHCVCPSWYGQTKVKIEKDCECEMGFAGDGFGGCTEICRKEGETNGGVDFCKTNCVGSVCECDKGRSLTYDRDTRIYTCEEIDCHLGNGNCSCGQEWDGADTEAVKYREESECQCVNNTLPLKDGTCTEPIRRSCVTCSSDDNLNACGSEVEIDGIRGITNKLCDKYTGYFGCWVEQHKWTNSSYYFRRGCGYYCTDSYDNNTYCYTNQKGTDEEEEICHFCCMDGDDCNILEIVSAATTTYPLQQPALVLLGLIIPTILLLNLLPLSLLLNPKLHFQSEYVLPINELN